MKHSVGLLVYAENNDVRQTSEVLTGGDKSSGAKKSTG